MGNLCTTPEDNRRASLNPVARKLFDETDKTKYLHCVYHHLGCETCELGKAICTGFMKEEGPRKLYPACPICVRENVDTGVLTQAIYWPMLKISYVFIRSRDNHFRTCKLFSNEKNAKLIQGDFAVVRGAKIKVYAGMTLDLPKDLQELERNVGLWDDMVDKRFAKKPLRFRYVPNMSEKMKMKMAAKEERKKKLAAAKAEKKLAKEKDSEARKAKVDCLKAKFALTAKTMLAKAVTAFNKKQ